MPINPVPVKDDPADEKKNIREFEKKQEKETGKDKKRNPQKPTFILSKPRYSFADMVLDAETKSALADAMAMMQYRDKILIEWDLGRVIKNSFNLCMNFYGEPGTGKTMAANAIAKQLELPILQVNYAEIESKYVGETSKNLVELFSQAEKDKALVLFDEADALLSRRVTDMSNATDVSVNQTRSVLLSQLDVFTGMVIFTTNFITNYDPAFMRRIPHHIRFNLPNEEIRLKLLAHYLDNTIPNQIDYAKIAKKYDGITGSDIANATLTSALRTARRKESVLSQDVFEESIEQILRSKRANNGGIKVVHINQEDISSREEIAIDCGGI